MMFRKAIKYSRKHFGLFGKLKNIADKRIKPRIATVKVAIAIFSIQLANLGSLNNFSQSVSNPSVSTIARSADTMSLKDIRKVNLQVYKKARKSKMLSPYCCRWIGIIDGKEITTSDYCKCNHCKRRKLRDKEGKLKYQYYHQFTAFILAGKDFSFTLDIEPILPGEGEQTSAYRLLERVCTNYPKAFSLVIGDGLYLNQKVFKLLEAHHKKTIAVLKEERRQLFEEANNLSLMQEPQIYTEGKTSYRVWDHAISGCWDGYGKGVRVIVSEETTKSRVHSKDGKGWQEVEEVTNWMWATNLDSSDSIGDLKNTVKVCHSRWHIENRCFKETANTWNAEHIYRHSENAIMVFLLFLFIAVNIFSIFRKRNIKDNKIKTRLNLILRIQADFLSLTRPLPPIPI
jgi:cbb3-type cytochrome oxidase subunit 3